MCDVLIYSYIVVYALPSSPARVVATAAVVITTSARSLTMFLVINKSLMSLSRGFLLPILVLSSKSVDGSSHSELYIVVCTLRVELFVVVTIICGSCSVPSGCVPLPVPSHPCHLLSFEVHTHIPNRDRIGDKNHLLIMSWQSLLWWCEVVLLLMCCTVNR